MAQSKEISREEQLVELSKRTDLNIGLLRRLPQEKITDYFNRSSEGGQSNAKFAVHALLAVGNLWLLALARVGVVAALVPAAPAGAATLFAIGAACFAVTAFLEYNRLYNNKEINEEIQGDLLDLNEKNPEQSVKVSATEPRL